MKKKQRSIPRAIGQLVRQDRIEYSGKVKIALTETMLTQADVIRALLLGKLVKKERDETGQALWKYTVIGPGLSGKPVYCAVKVLARDDNLFVLTAHWADD